MNTDPSGLRFGRVMRSVAVRLGAEHGRTKRARLFGFSLVELLSVMALFTLFMAFLVPAVSGIKGGRDVTRAAYDLAGLLEQARTYALAHNTYVWVGFFEEDGMRPSAQPAVVGNGGRIVVSVVASRNGSRYSDAVVDNATPAAFGAGGASNTVPLVPISRLFRFDNLRMVAVNGPGALPERPQVPAAYQVGDPASGGPDNARGSFAILENAPGGNPVTFTHPLGVSNPQYTFTKIIEFNPRGEASKIAENVFAGPGVQDVLEIAVQPTRGDRIDPRFEGDTLAAAAIQVEGLTGRVRIYRP